MTNDFSHDEVQFIASAQTLVRYRLIPYVDYPFLHMPYQVFLNALVIPFTNYHFLTVRLLSSFFTLLTVGAYIIFLEQNRQRLSFQLRFLILTLGILFYLTNAAFVTLDGRALNHTVPAFFSILALWMFSRSMLFLTGLLIGLAIGFRLWYAVLLLPVFIGISMNYWRENWRVFLKKALTFSSGIFTALIPVAWIFFASPRAFIYGNFTYIRLNTLYREQLGHTNAMSLVEKFNFFVEYLLQSPSNFLLYIIFLLCIFLFIALPRTYFSDNQNKVVLLLFTIFLLIASFSPTPLWPQYFFAPLPFIVLFSTQIFTDLINKNVIKSKVIILFIPILILLIISYQTITDNLNLHNPQKWIPLHVHQSSINLKAIQAKGRVLTLNNAFVLEANLDVYPQFNTGPFAWRTSNFLSPERRKQIGVVSPAELERFLEKEPPQSILTGFESVHEGFTKNDPGGLEKPFIEYANKNGYVPFELQTEFFPQPLILWMKQSN